MMTIIALQKMGRSKMKILEIMFQLIAFAIVGSMVLTYLIIFIWCIKDVCTGKGYKWNRKGRRFWQ